MATALDAVQVKVRVDPAVAEPAVWRVISTQTDVRSVLLADHARRAERVYELDDPVVREAAFAMLALTEFEELGLADPLRKAVAERPALGARAHVLLVGAARAAHEEGVTCEPVGAHLGFRVEGWRFADPPGLLRWARHALGHAEDTLDPSFHFAPGWDGDGGAGATVRTAAQARLHRLWDITVDARLAALGVTGGAGEAEHRERLAADLPGAPADAVDVAFARLWDGPRPDFPTLLGWAERPVTLVADLAIDALAEARPDRCPLCGFPSDDVATPGPAVAERVAADYPRWIAALGLCGRCDDRYRLAGRLGGAR